MKNNYILFVVLLFAAIQLRAQEPILLEEILVQANKEQADVKSNVMTDKIVIGQPRNMGAIFSGVPGFGIVKRGGYAMEPVLRSFKYDQINLQYDGGMQVASACANRMDPMSTRINADEIHKVEIIKGPYSVRFGQSLGGILNIVTERPKSTDSLTFSGLIDGGYEFNGQSKYGRFALTAAQRKFDVYLGGGIRDFGNYDNGDGKTIASEFQTADYVAKLGINPAQNQRLQFTWRQSFSDKILHAGLPMDARDDMSYVASADYVVRKLGPVLNSIQAKAYYSYVDHWMTNEWRPAAKMVDALTGVTSEVIGGKLELTLTPVSGVNLFTGLDYKRTGKDGERTRHVKINPCTGVELPVPADFTDLVWQDSWLSNLGAFAETRWQPNERLLVIAGLRIDMVQSGINNPATNFSELWGDELQPADELNFSANATLNYSFARGYGIQWSVGRGTRAASLLERYINHFTVGMDAYEYMGNPNLKAEKNLQTDLSFTKAGENYMLYANVFYSYINDYITAYVDETMPRVYTPCADPKFTKRFTNIDEARQTGFELGARAKFGKYWHTDANVAYTYAQNLSWDEPLSEVPPLTVNATLAYRRTQFSVQLDAHIAAAQSRVAESFGETTTPAYEVFNLSVEYSPAKFVSLRAGVNNLLNANYYDHLSRAYKAMPETSMFYEPGRNITLGAQFRF